MRSGQVSDFCISASPFIFIVMYWYISFLRPPPVSVESGGTITITPQVANDLRTELRYDPTEIYYTWQRTEPSIQPSLPSEHLTSFVPPESTYRPLSIPLPAKAGIGEKWRLCLFAPGPPASSLRSDSVETGRQDILALTGPSAKCSPISVWSEGIEIVRPAGASTGGVTKGVGGQGGKGRAKGKGKAEDKDKAKGKGKEKDETVKQTRITREWSTPSGVLKVVEQTSFDLDKKIWDSGLALSSWLYRHIPAAIAHPADTSDLPKPEPRARFLLGYVTAVLGITDHAHNIIELGSGTGLVSIALHSMIGAKAMSNRGRIIATDLESALELMDENMSLNQSSNAPEADEGLCVHARVLDWDQPLPAWISDDSRDVGKRWPSLIISADVTYNTASFPSLVRTLTALLRPGSPDEKQPMLLLAYKQRDPGERELWKMLEDVGIVMRLADTIEGADGGEGAVEIWLGSCEESTMMRYDLSDYEDTTA
ncbi:putative methyltransferase-domain-containing protein [Dioszegia hungarica]|uniref:Methyltransferase-domain-containing protein n=1 Tax=Dioszegia hungarica TaxID=4972 RepID=A0AA38H4K4_9TREE|nr:putative methyltransferase-domain-containing protein [Dioszegia hungarica]KAI9632484.1 putative methyltransferase-domain-containing protein [Dioszegia hungarica]